LHKQEDIDYLVESLEAAVAEYKANVKEIKAAPSFARRVVRTGKSSDSGASS
jgi:hypothetical protein